jgi:methionyl-tRNA synthetase
MLSAKAAGISPEEWIAQVHKEHVEDFSRFLISFDNYYSTHSPENRYFSELIFQRLKAAGSIIKRPVEQAYCEHCRMSLPDRYIRGTCPRCKAPDQYGDCCEVCGATYRPTDLLDPYCATCKTKPTTRTSEHYFFRLADYQDQLRALICSGYTPKTVANKLEEWFAAGLRDWDISRDGPYFGFLIPGEKDKYFYVWLDAPIGYMASAKNYFDRMGEDFSEVWPGPSSASPTTDWQIHHFIGKDIMYFHALFWPAMLIGAGFKAPDRLFVHGFLTVNGEKMSKSRGTFIKAQTFAKHLNPEFLRYYYASKLSDNLDDIDLSTEDLVSKINADLVGKFANLASRSIQLLHAGLRGRLGQLDPTGSNLFGTLVQAREEIASDYEGLRFSSVVRRVLDLADQADRFLEARKPWDLVKTAPEQARDVLTAGINAVKCLATYLKPVIPTFAAKIEQMLCVGPLDLSNIDQPLQGTVIGPFQRLFERVDPKEVQRMIEETKSSGDQQPPSPTADHAPAMFKPECTIEDFDKLDIRVARVISAERVQGADKLLRLLIDVGGTQKTVFAGIAKAYQPEQLTGRLVVYLANLRPRKMRFGLSEGMILAAGPGDGQVYLLAPDPGAQPGQKVT